MGGALWPTVAVHSRATIDTILCRSLQQSARRAKIGGGGEDKGAGELALYKYKDFQRKAGKPSGRHDPRPFKKAQVEILARALSGLQMKKE